MMLIGKIIDLQLLILLCAFICSSEGQSASSKTPGASGKAVSEEVVNLINNSGIFRDDQRFLIRIAWVESKFGQDKNTYRLGYDGGIWQVDRIGFEDTKNVKAHNSLKGLLDKVQAAFSIDWTNVQWQDLRKPLYSGLAARIFLSNKPEAIPATVNGQAAYWKKYYNSASGAGSEAKFINDVKALEG